ncbi:ABC transporter substrate-binding protein [Paenibacillus sp. TRM 82003]|uniref:ABC transporter substrate-binding protein n=1 Tax=Kineococcus sp. TRM81007 TaxID=2925831 RepID=UPI001F572D4A|nr:ABC transporter substrate-binding protein [Kineococcus sp. TRM81007]MCI2238156.1 ABC transporter substrate-binding protein [Kineococcus sp. TRM81007]MCI3920540.1 ABC transporter substrate-binding protein [Paenibacillus sp. TRM 82003]
MLRRGARGALGALGGRGSRVAAVLALAVVLAPAGCGAGGDADPVRVGFSQLSAEGSWRAANTASIRSALTPADGFELTFSDDQRKQEGQIAVLRGFIAADVDVIAFSPVVQDGWDQVLREARDAGVPVVLVDRSTTSRLDGAYVTRVGADFRAEGERAGRWVREHAPGARVFELQGTLGSGAQVARQQGFRAVVGDQVVGEATGAFTRAGGRDVTAAALEAWPEVDLVFAHNDDMALGAVEAVRAAGLRPGVDVRVVSVDGTREALRALADGEIAHVVECDPLFGEQLAAVLRRVAAGERVPDRVVVPGRGFDRSVTEAEIEARTY